MSIGSHNFLSCINYSLVNTMVQRILFNVLIPKRSPLRNNCLYLMHEWTRNGPTNSVTSVFCKCWDKVKEGNREVAEKYVEPLELGKDRARRARSLRSQKYFVYKNSTMRSCKEMYENKENINRMANLNPFIPRYSPIHGKAYAKCKEAKDIGMKIGQRVKYWIENSGDFEEEMKAMHSELVEKKLTGNQEQDLRFALNLLRELPALIIRAQRSIACKEQDTASPSYSSAGGVGSDNVLKCESNRSKGSPIDNCQIKIESCRVTSRLRINDTMQISKKELDDMELPEYEDIPNKTRHEVDFSAVDLSKDEVVVTRPENEWFSNIPNENVWEISSALRIFE